MDLPLELTEVLTGASLEFFSFEENPMEDEPSTPYKDGYREIRIVGNNTNPYFSNGLWRILLVHTLPECSECEAFWDGCFYILPVPESTTIESVSYGKKTENKVVKLYAHIALKDTDDNLYTYTMTLPEETVSLEQIMITIH